MADDDSFEAGLVVDDPAFSEEIDTDDTSSSGKTSNWLWGGLAVVGLLLIALGILKYHNSK